MKLRQSEMDRQDQLDSLTKSLHWHYQKLGELRIAIEQAKKEHQEYIQYIDGLSDFKQQLEESLK